MAIADPQGIRPPNSRAPRYGIDLATTKPGTPGGIFMRQFWHPVARSVDLFPGRALPVRRMNEDYALYRGQDGVPYVVAARCPHRGALMQMGWVENDDIRCVYHGWKYDCMGQCVEAPAEKAGFEKNVRIAVYPTAEAFGLVYTYFGPGQPPAFPPYPESHGEGIIEPWMPVDVPCNYLQSFENSMDEVHVAYTHSPGGSHASLAHELPIITAEETPWGMMRLRTACQRARAAHVALRAEYRTRHRSAPGRNGRRGWLARNHVPLRSGRRREPHLVQHDQSPGHWRRRRTLSPKARQNSTRSAPQLRTCAIWSTRFGRGELPTTDVRHPELARIQDIAVQAGQGRIEDRETETLGRSDAGIAVWRRILERELSTIAAGGKPKTWERPPGDVIPTLGTA